jgi:hypothetical protein
MSICRASTLFFVVSTFVALTAPAAFATAADSDTATAKALNVTRAELPVSVKWAAASQLPNTATDAALGVKAVQCIRAGGRAAGKISTDPFGTTEVVGGKVTTDVKSSDFFVTGSTNSGASVSSEVVLLKNSTEATDDLSALSTGSARTCFTTLFVAIGKETGGGSVKATLTLPSIPHLGTGRGGLDFRVVLKGGNLSGPILDDTYFYVQGRAEFALSFVSLKAQFPVTWANEIAARVMDKARSILG